MSTMRAVVYDRPGQFSVRELPVPEPGPGEVRLRVLVAGVCGTDLHLHAGEFGPTYPLTPGHEFVGEVVALGEGVGPGLLGHRVVVDNTASCGRCVECRRARPAYCRHLVAQGVNAPGGFAEQVVTDADRCFLVDDLEPEVAVLSEPVACVVHGLDMLDLSPGSDVLLFGAGPTGLILTSLLARSGAGRLVVAAPTPAKLELARARGADETVQLDRADPAAAEARLRELAPDGFDVVIDATGAPAVLAPTLGLTRTGGTVFVYGMTPEATQWPVSPYDIFRRELTVKGSFAQQFSFDRALSALRTGRVSSEGLITRRFGLEQYADALAAVADSSVVKVVLVP
ncbi:zinc-dependent alcohol dehydrogenase family protein [uncultured Friedmanniella sp.]|uniref:zinc-dependent alcohol dehydrogenase family protein n=1 Tax=uncultured Friedmanniella sp. TaxID=335381 RepID=UPI0035CB0C30